jgi:hypothetical protein
VVSTRLQRAGARASSATQGQGTRSALLPEEKRYDHTEVRALLGRPRHRWHAGVSVCIQVTIIDATHPLYGCTLPLVRTPSPHSKAQLFVQLPDGRVQKLPRKVTDFEAATSTPRPHALIAVPTLVPLARLLCAMLAGKEDVCHDTDPTVIRPCDATSDQLPASDLVAPARQPPSAPTGPLPLRADPTDTGCQLPRCQGALS